MIAGSLLWAVALGYVGLLFAVAWWGERTVDAPRPARLRIAVYALALAVYCSSWTFYGAVGTATRSGLGYLPIYLGPILLFWLGWRVLERLILASAAHNVVSIGDFLSARYGRAPMLAAVVALLAVTAAIPYVALQFKAVGMSVAVLSGTPASMAWYRDPALAVALLLAAFSIGFGTRRIDATEHHRGMVLAIALESLVKLVAFIAIGLLALGLLPGVGDGLLATLQSGAERLRQPLPSAFLAQTLLGLLAIICLPRQFHVAVVECLDPADLRPARWLFIGYLAIFSLLVLPIALAGQAVLPADIDPDRYMLALPLAQGNALLSLAAFVGGLSAATGMVIVASVALATMVSNDLVVPLLLKRKAVVSGEEVLWIRRATIVLLALLAFVWHRYAAVHDLAENGLLAFAAVAQFAPALIGALYWRGATRRGAVAGLLAGGLLWLWCLFLPTLLSTANAAPHWIAHGPFGIDWLRPQGLFGLDGLDPLSHGVLVSLLANIGTFVVVSLRRRPLLQDQLAAAGFLDPYAQRPQLAPGGFAGKLPAGELQALAAHVLGEEDARVAFTDYAAAQGQSWQPEQPADRALVQFTERLLSAAIGAASARATLTSLMRGSGMELGDMVALLDRTSHALRFNREVLSTTLDNMPQGVSVIDEQQRLVTWNRRYQEMFDYPEGMLFVGRPVQELIRYNARRDGIPAAGIEDYVLRRTQSLRAGQAYSRERVRADGRVLQMHGQPLAGGGYVTSYHDITGLKRAEQALREANETLEARVESRTREAEAAQQSKLRFLAAVSHDVLQPMNAARLFASALREGATGEQAHLAERIDASLRAAEDLLDGLLDISRMDAGTLVPEVGVVDAGELLRELAAQYAPIAQRRGLQLRTRLPRVPVAVASDRRLLRRALQNFLANALRYTRHGGVLLAARRRGGRWSLEIWDTGPGIPEHHLTQIFEEFRRFDAEAGVERGLGIGLSICQRIAGVLGHALGVRSRVGHGSVFRLQADAAALPPPAQEPAAAPTPADALAGLRVLCVDNDAEILAGMRTLLGRWQVHVLDAATVDQALAEMARQPQVLLVDYHLHDRLDGLELVRALRAAAGSPLPAALLTGDGSDALKQAARAVGCSVLTKPVRPASLRAFLAQQAQAPA